MAYYPLLIAIAGTNGIPCDTRVNLRRFPLAGKSSVARGGQFGSEFPRLETRSSVKRLADTSGVHCQTMDLGTTRRSLMVRTADSQTDSATGRQSLPDRRSNGRYEHRKERAV
ncbi:MAG: hypothetical protein HQ402_04065 [Parcubacteria group bacterium]|nr:hypothetical protein [Parcubacteria group bacterium]